MSYKVFQNNLNEGITIYESLLKPKEIVLMVGSAIDIFPPTNILNGMTMSEEIIKLLVSFLPSNKSIIRKLLVKIPFEYINEKCPNYEVVKRIIINECYPKKPNDLHKAIADLVQSGIIHSIITPNYDLCLENYLPNNKPLFHVNSYGDSKGINQTSRILFKIHGSADTLHEKNMVCRLSEEGLLPRWKKDVLVKNLSGRHLVVLCYSGLDFEICPEILNIQLHSLIWNFLRNPNRRKSELTEYAKRMLEKFNKSTTYGDVSFSLSNLGVKIASIIPDKKILHKNKSDFGKKLKSAFSEIELLEWSCALMAQPGYARQTKEVSDKLLVKIKKPSLDSGKYYSFQAEALFFMGKYRDAVKFCGKASEIFLNFNNWKLYYLSEIRKIDSLRCWGKNKKAYKVLNTIRSELINKSKLPPEIKKDFITRLQLQEILLLREHYELAKLLNNKITEMKKRKEIEAILKSIVPIEEKKGNWFDLQQCHLWADRVGINFSSIYKGPLQPLENIEGYRKLGHIIAEMMCARDALRKNSKSISRKTFEKYIEYAQIINSNSELWKLYIAKNKYYKIDNFWERVEWIKPFFRCQYTIPMRLRKFISERTI